MAASGSLNKSLFLRRSYTERIVWYDLYYIVLYLILYDVDLYLLRRSYTELFVWYDLYDSYSVWVWLEMFLLKEMFVIKKSVLDWWLLIERCRTY